MSRGRRFGLPVVAVLVLVGTGPGVGASGAGSLHGRPGPARVALIEVDEVVDRLNSGAVAACRAGGGHRGGGDGCTLRAALAVAASSPGSVVVLPAGVVSQRIPRPFEIRGSVTVRGRGPTATTVVGVPTGPLFSLADGARLTLSGLTAGSATSSLRGGPGDAMVVLRDLVLADQAGFDAVEAARRAVALCVVGGPDRSLAVREAVVTDPIARRTLPGGVF